MNVISLRLASRQSKDVCVCVRELYEQAWTFKDDFNTHQNMDKQKAE